MAQADDDFDWTTAVPVEDETSSTLAATPFGARTQPQPTQGPVVYDDEFDWKTAELNEDFDASTARPLTAQEEHAYYKGLDEASRDPARILTNSEHSSLYDWRQQQDDAVSRFFEGASDIPGNLAQIAVDATKETAQNYAENYALNRGRFYKRNIATGMEAGRKIGVQLLQLFDWGQNKAADIVERGRANDVKMREIAAQVPKTGDERVDGDNVMAAIAKAREEGVFDETPFGPNKEEDYDRYLRQNSYNRTHAGTITEATMGGKTMTFPEEQLSFMGEKPMQSVATGGAMIFDPVNALPVGAGIFSKLRILRRLSRVTGMPLPAVERGLAGAADGMESFGSRVAARVTDKTGLSKTQQVATASAVGGGAGLLAANTDGMDGVLLPVAALASVPVLYKAVGGTIRKTSQAAGVGAEVVREMRAGNIGSMRQAAAEDLLRTGTVPKPYADFMQPYANGVESTLGRIAKNPNNAEITRKLSRLADNTGVTQAFRFTDDAVSSGVAATLASTPFALLAPDEEQAGAIVGGAATLGTFAGPVTGAFARRQGAVNADIARMLIDVHAVNGDVPALLSLGRDRLGQIAGMQGIVAGKTDFVTLRASDYRANVDLRKSGNETKAGVFIEKASDGTARIFINVGEPVSMDGKVRVRDRGDGVREIRVRGADGRTEFIAAPKNRRLLVNDGDTVKAGQQVVDYLPATRSIPHEIAHAILTSDILDGDIRTDMQNYVTQVYGEDGIQARGREYIGKIVDGDIMFGTHEGQVILTPEEAADVRSGKRTMSDVMKGKPVEAAERDALIAARIDEYNQRSRENGGNDWDWARNEVIAEQFAGESQGIDFRAIRRGGPKLMESALATSARVLEALGAKFDRTTGKPLDNPSVLFRDNPLFQSPVLRKRMIEHVRAYNDLLTGLEEAGKREARGTKVSVDGTPESAARSPHMKQRADQDQGGRVGNEFLYTDETGKTQWRSPSEVRGRENARTSQAKTLYNPSRIVSPTSTEFGPRRTDSGRTVIGGPTLPAQFDHFVHFPKWFREFARTLEASRERGGTFIADYNAIGDGKDGTYRVRNRGDIRAILREVAFVGWEMTRNNHLKTVLVDLNAFRGATMRAINDGALGIFNNDMAVIEADLKTYLDNHKNGRPSETGIGQAKRDMLNGLIGTGTAVQRKANPLYSDLNPRGSVRSFRLDRYNDLTPTGREGYSFDYDKINNNRMPSALPQAGMAMPEVAPVMETYLDREYNPNVLAERAEREGYALVYHGDKNQPGNNKYKPWKKASMPLFTALQPEGADWYGDPRPLFVKTGKVASYEDMISAARKVGVKGRYGDRSGDVSIPEVKKHSQYDGANENDLLYIPRVREELRRQGFDAVRVWDQLERDEIEALIVIGSPDQIVDPLARPATGRTRGQAMPDVDGSKQSGYDNTYLKQALAAGTNGKVRLTRPIKPNEALPLLSQVEPITERVDKDTFTYDRPALVELYKNGEQAVAFKYDPDVLVRPSFKDVAAEHAGKQVQLAMADRQSAVGGDMGGVMNTYLKSLREVKITDPMTGGKLIAVWANNDWKPARAMKGKAAAGAKDLLTYLMGETAHGSNLRSVRRISNEIDNAPISAKEKNAFLIIANRGVKKARTREYNAAIAAAEIKASKLKERLSVADAKNKAEIRKQLNRVMRTLGDAKTKISKYKISAEEDEFSAVVRNYRSARTGYENGTATLDVFKTREEEFFKYLDGFKRVEYREKTKRGGEKKAYKYVPTDAFKKLQAVIRGKHMVTLDNTFDGRKAAVEDMLGLTVSGFNIDHILPETADFQGGRINHIVSSVELSTNPELGAAYLGDDPQQAKFMTPLEAAAAKKMKASSKFTIHEAYAWVMLGPEDGNHFLNSNPKTPEQYFPTFKQRYAETKTDPAKKATFLASSESNQVNTMRDQTLFPLVMPAK